MAMGFVAVSSKPVQAAAFMFAAMLIEVMMVMLFTVFVFITVSMFFAEFSVCSMTLAVPAVFTVTAVPIGIELFGQSQKRSLFFI